MQVTLEIPDTVAAQITAAGREPARTALEAFALEGYRTKELSESEIRRMLGFETRMEVHAFLKEHGVYLHYSVADLDHDRQTSLRQQTPQRQ